MRKKLWIAVAVPVLAGMLIVIVAIGAVVVEMEKTIAFGAKQHKQQSTGAVLDNMPPWVTPEIILTCLEIQGMELIYIRLLHRIIICSV